MKARRAASSGGAWTSGGQRRDALGPRRRLGLARRAQSAGALRVQRRVRGRRPAPRPGPPRSRGRARPGRAPARSRRAPGGAVSWARPRASVFSRPSWSSGLARGVARRALGGGGGGASASAASSRARASAQRGQRRRRTPALASAAPGSAGRRWRRGRPWPRRGRALVRGQRGRAPRPAGFQRPRRPASLGGDLGGQAPRPRLRPRRARLRPARQAASSSGRRSGAAAISASSSRQLGGQPGERAAWRPRRSGSSRRAVGVDAGELAGQPRRLGRRCSASRSSRSLSIASRCSTARGDLRLLAQRRQGGLGRDQRGLAAAAAPAGLASTARAALAASASSRSSARPRLRPAGVEHAPTAGRGSRRPASCTSRPGAPRAAGGRALVSSSPSTSSSRARLASAARSRSSASWRRRVQARDAGRLLQDQPPVLRLGGDQLGDLALAHQGRRIGAGGGVGEQQLHVARAHLAAVDPVGRALAPVDPARRPPAPDRSLNCAGARAVGVVDGELTSAWLREGRPPEPAKITSSMPPAAHGLGGVGAHHPAQGLQQVRLAAAVRARRRRSGPARCGTRSASTKDLKPERRSRWKCTAPAALLLAGLGGGDGGRRGLARVCSPSSFLPLMTKVGVALTSSLLGVRLDPVVQRLAAPCRPRCRRRTGPRSCRRPRRSRSSAPWTSPAAYHRCWPRKISSTTLKYLSLPAQRAIRKPAAADLGRRRSASRGRRSAPCRCR